MNLKTETILEQIDDLFNARSVAIIGVPRGFKAGKLFLLALLDQGYTGAIYPVNPLAKDIDGLKCYPTLSAVPGPVDLAIVLTPHDQTLGVVKECAQKGVKGVVLFTAGYKETGTEAGAALEAEIVALARSSGMRLIGPNGMGLYCPKTGLSFFPRLSKVSGPIGLISHSGSLTNILGFMGPRKNLCFSKVVSLGNECDLSTQDLLAYLGQDHDTRVIGAYIEGIQNGPAFLKALRRASLNKPVVLWKMGLTEEGSRAAASHTGAMAGKRPIWEGVVAQGGGIAVEGFEAFADTLMAFSLLPHTIGRRVAVISGPGGLAVSAAEACGKEGLQLADLSAATRQALKALIPAVGTSAQNPVDVGLTASIDIELYIQSVRIAAADPGVDLLVIIGIGLSPEINRHYTEALIQARNEYQKPFVMVNIPGFEPELGQRFCEAGIPFFDSAERAMAGLSRIIQYRQWRQVQTEPDLETEHQCELKGWPKINFPSPAGRLSEYQAKQFLAAHGIPVTREILVRTADELPAAMTFIGYPLVMKGASGAVDHKTEKGIVITDIRTEAEAQAAFHRIMVRLEGDGKAVLVQEMIQGQRELVAGMVRDPQFGPCVMFGLGGIFTEILQDRAFRVAPLLRQDALELMGAIAGRGILEGVRGMPPVDKQALADVLMALGRIGLAHDNIDQIDINPLIIQGDRPVAVDALIILK